MSANMDTVKLEAELAKMVNEAYKLGAETAKLNAETIKLQAETAKLNREARWYPAIAAAAFIGGVVAVAKLFMPS